MEVLRGKLPMCKWFIFRHAMFDYRMVLIGSVRLLKNQMVFGVAMLRTIPAVPGTYAPEQHGGQTPAEGRRRVWRVGWS